MAQILFFYFSGITVLGAIVAVASPHLIYSALSLLVTFIHIAGLYILLHAEFIAVIQIIIYAGAILVLYLFVLMLFPQQESLPLHRQSPIGILGGLGLLALMVFAAFRSEILGQKGAPITQIGNTEAIGHALYTDYIFPFEMASFILLVAMFGAILLVGRKVRRKQDGPP